MALEITCRARRGGNLALATGTDFDAMQYAAQHMKVILDGIGLGMGVDQVNFEIVASTQYEGWTGNATDAKVEGANHNDDFSFAELVNQRLVTGTMGLGQSWTDI
jgi:hypothetical protein